MKKIFLIGLLCTLFVVSFFESSFAQDKREQRLRMMKNFAGRWKDPEIGSVIADFELNRYEGGKFKLSDQRGKILVLEMGACT